MCLLAVEFAELRSRQSVFARLPSTTTSGTTRAAAKGQNAECQERKGRPCLPYPCSSRCGSVVVWCQPGHHIPAPTLPNSLRSLGNFFPVLPASRSLPHPEEKDSSRRSVPGPMNKEMREEGRLLNLCMTLRQNCRCTSTQRCPCSSSGALCCCLVAPSRAPARLSPHDQPCALNATACSSDDLASIKCIVSPAIARVYNSSNSSQQWRRLWHVARGRPALHVAARLRPLPSISARSRGAVLAARASRTALREGAMRRRRPPHSPPTPVLLVLSPRPGRRRRGCHRIAPPPPPPAARSRAAAVDAPRGVPRQPPPVS